MILTSWGANCWGQNRSRWNQCLKIAFLKRKLSRHTLVESSWEKDSREMDHETKQVVQLVRSDLLRCKTAHMRQIFSYGWRSSHGFIEPIFLHKIELWVSLPMPPIWSQSTSCSKSYARLIKDWPRKSSNSPIWRIGLNGRVGSSKPSNLPNGRVRPSKLPNSPIWRFGPNTVPSSHSRSILFCDQIKLTPVSSQSESPSELYSLETAKNSFSRRKFGFVI